MTTEISAPVGVPDPRYGNPQVQAPAWAVVEQLLTDAELYWLTTVRADGRPHTVPLVGVWHARTFAFGTGPDEQKARKISSGNGQVTVTTGINSWTQGIDVVVEGRATRITGVEHLEPLAAAWRDKYRPAWAWRADDDGFVDDDGRRPVVFVVEPAKVIAFGKGADAAQTTFRL